MIALINLGTALAKKYEKMDFKARNQLLNRLAFGGTAEGDRRE